MACDVIASSSDNIPQSDKIVKLHEILEHISPMPKTKAIRKRKRTAQHAEVLIISPFRANCKNALKSPLSLAPLKMDGWMDGWLGFNGILSMQVAAISCLKKFKVC